MYDESRIQYKNVRKSEISDVYDEIFHSLSKILQNVVTSVAQGHDAAAYYECCDKMHAAWLDGEIVEDDGFYSRFKRNEFEQFGWIDVSGSTDWADPTARSPLGLSGEILIHTPLARVTLGRADVTDDMRDRGVVGDFVFVELDIHLAIRPDIDDPRDAGALILHPFVASLDEELSNLGAKKPSRWWNDFPQVSLELTDNTLVQHILRKGNVIADQHLARAISLSAGHVDQLRIVPLSKDTCQAWLSFGSNSAANDFEEFFWADAAGSSNAKELVSAPSGTLAGKIQTNLVLADACGRPSVRLDKLLAADAQRKTEALRRLLARKKQNFEARLSEAGLSSFEPKD